MKKILITGGSGFIGTNLIEMLKKKAFTLLSIDIVPPKLDSHKDLWKKVDICDKEKLSKTIVEFQPEVIIHLAARTDLNGKNLEDYSANILGVKNLLEVLKEIKSLQRAVFASSMYVCKPGYIPKNFEDYQPHTIYGESKVLTEKIIKEQNPNQYTYCMVRPTSIWGPWFGEPYAHFFDIVMSKKYFHMGEKACTKTYGYVENTIQQFLALLEAEPKEISRKVFYLGDWPAYDISNWADEIARYIKIKIPRLPYFMFQVAAFGGDILKKGGVSFPMTSFRLKNMTTNNVHDLSPIRQLSPNLAVSRKTGTEKTVDWIKAQKKLHLKN